MAPNEFRSIHIRTLSGWRALVAAGFVLALFAVLAFLAFGLFLLLLPMALAVGIASLFLRKREPVFLHRTTRRGPKVIETDYKVVSEERTHDDSRTIHK